MRSKGRKPIIGITGGIGAGKSLVADIMRELGAAIVDSDRLARQELSDPQVMLTLRQWWGQTIVGSDGAIDRSAVAAIVFVDRTELKRLEDLLYPRIDRHRQSLVDDFQQDSDVRAIVYDAPKLYEAGLDRKCDCVVFVDAPWEVRVGRATQSRGWDEAELRKREKMQDPLEPKRAKADYVVSNQFDIKTLRPTVQQVFNSVLASVPN